MQPLGNHHYGGRAGQSCSTREPSSRSSFATGAGSSDGRGVASARFEGKGLVVAPAPAMPNHRASSAVALTLADGSTLAGASERMRSRMPSYGLLPLPPRARRSRSEM